MWQDVIFLGMRFLGYVPSQDLWNSLADGNRPSEKHILAQLSDDGPFRWVLSPPSK